MPPTRRRRTWTPRRSAWTNGRPTAGSPPSEKKQLKEELARIDGDKTQVTDGYTKYGLGTPTAYNTAYTNYRTAINGVVSSSSETVAIPSDFATKRTAYYTQKSAALTAISDAAKAYADKVVAGLK